MKKLITLLVVLCIQLNSNAQQTYVPDDNFEQALIDLGYDSGALDDYVPTQNIANILELNVRNKNISDLTGIEGFTDLKILNCSQNNLINLEISANISLNELNCSRNDLTTLNLNANLALEKLFCHLNQLSSLNIYYNSLLTELNCYYNNLTSINTSTNTLLTVLDCSINQISSLYLNNNILLEILNCKYNQLNFINVIQNSLLTELNCSNNNITNLNVSTNTLLTILRCSANNINTLNVSGNVLLENFSCSSNNLNELNIVFNTLLRNLSCGSNNLSELSVSTNSVLKYISCSSNSLTTLDFSNNILLEYITCSNNNLTELDVSMIPNLRNVICNFNDLTAINMKNGNNTNIFFFWSFGNYNLSCVEVDDANYSTTNWTSIDATTSFSEDCHYGFTYVPNNNFEQTLINLGYDDVLDDYVLTANIENVISLDLVNDHITDLTGIEDFTNLENLYCRGNNLTTLDLSQNLALRLLRCQSNYLTNLDLSNNVNLTELRCNRNDLITLNVSNNANLEVLYCQKNNLVNLDISNNIHLQFFSAFSNQLEQLSINNTSNSSNSINNIINFDIRYNKNLNCVEVNDAAWSTANWPNKDAHTYYYEGSCNYPNITSTKIDRITTKLLISEKLIVSNTNNSMIRVKTNNNSTIIEIKMFDVLGKLVVGISPNQSDLTIPTNVNKGSILFVKALLENGNVLNTKFIKL